MLDGKRKGQVTIETYIAVLAYLLIMVLILVGLQGILTTSKSTTETFQMRMAIQHAKLTGTIYVLDGFKLNRTVSYPLYGVNISYMQSEALINHSNGKIDSIGYNITILGGNPI